MKEGHAVEQLKDGVVQIGPDRTGGAVLPSCAGSWVGQAIHDGDLPLQSGEDITHLDFRGVAGQRVSPLGPPGAPNEPRLF